VVALEKTLVLVILEDVVEEMLIMDLVVVLELLIKEWMEEMVLTVEHMVTPVRVAVELEPLVYLYLSQVMAVAPVLLDTVKLLQLTDRL
jgi:hypothetical protein